VGTRVKRHQLGEAPASGIQIPTLWNRTPTSLHSSPIPPVTLLDPVDPRTRRALQFLSTIPPAISGQGGHVATWRAALGLVRGCNLNQDEAYSLLAGEFNSACSPPWSPHELWHKVQDAAAKAQVPSGYLLDRPDADFTDDQWKVLLKRMKSGSAASTLANLTTVLVHAPEWLGVLGFDERGQRAVFCLPPPWDPDVGVCNPIKLPVEFTDEDSVRLCVWAERKFGLTVTTDTSTRAAMCIAHSNRIDPVKRYLDGLRWDGVKRLDTWLKEFLGAPDTDFITAVGPAFLIAAVARTFSPGAKVDNVLVLEGPQDQGKSTALRILAGDDHFLDSLPDIRGKDGLIQLQSAWIVELAELDAVTRQETSTVKAFLSRCVDRFRPPYGRVALDHPRRCVFAATTNDAEYLKDPTGNRRIWPVRCTCIDTESLGRTRDLLWAEAVVRYKAGEPWWLTVDAIREEATGEQAARYAPDVWEEKIAALVSLQRYQAAGVSTNEVLEHLGVELAQQDRGKQMRVAASLQRLGWTRTQKWNRGKAAWKYFPAEGPIPIPPPTPGVSLQV
jgi:predicted P-loop ATPase